MATPKKRHSNLKSKTVESSGDIFDNTTEETVIINVSKARLIYNKHIKRQGNGGLCLTFLGLFLSCFVTLFTSTFKDIFGVQNSSYIINAIFILACGGFLIATIIFFIKWICGCKKYNEKTFIADLKNQGDDFP